VDFGHSCRRAQGGVSVEACETLEMDDEQARSVALLHLDKGAVLAHRFDRPLAAPSDDG
jgi:hypothetical protein